MSFQTLYRLVVMSGTIVVASMAWRVYGPPVEQIHPLWERARQGLIDLWNSPTTPPLAEEGAPELFDGSVEGLLPLAESERHRDQAVGPAGWNEPPRLAPRDVATRLPQPVEPIEVGETSVAVDGNPDNSASVSAVFGRLQELGVKDYSLSPWGTSSGLYRCRCSAPWGTRGSYHRHFEAVAGSAAEAAQQVLADVEQWYSSQTGQAASQIR